MITELEKQLKVSIKGDVLADDNSRAIYAVAACIYRILPKVIVKPKNTQDVISAVNIARSHGLPVTARGAGSGVTGAAIGEGIILDFSKYMNRIINVGGDQVTVEPGVIYGKLNKKLLETDRKFPPDPSSGDYCTIGGMLANNSSGARSVKYGATRNWVRELTFVTASGELVNTYDQTGIALSLKEKAARLIIENSSAIKDNKPDVTKFSSGYYLWDDSENMLNNLIVGSEGTLGIIVEARLNTAPVLPARATLLLTFPTLEAAGEAVPLLREHDPSAIELLDDVFVKLVRSQRPEASDILPDEDHSLLIVEFEGASRDEVEGSLEKAVSSVKRLVSDAIRGLSGNDVDRIWFLRKAASPIIGSLKGPKRATRFVEDVVTRPENLADFLHRFRDILSSEDAMAPAIGHAGEGNIHINPLLDLRDPADVRKMRRIADKVYDLAAKSGGALSGEHGDGRMRAPYLKEFFGTELYSVYKEIKKVFDPNGLLNPGVKLNDLGRITDNLKTKPGGWRAKKDESFLAEPKWQEEVERCHGCGACRNVCPTFEATLEEAASPRGRVSILRAWAENSIDHAPPIGESYESSLALKCIFCMRCLDGCPSFIDAGGLSAYWKSEVKNRRGVLQKLRDHALTRPNIVGRLSNTIPGDGDPRKIMPGFLESAMKLKFGNRPLKFNEVESIHLNQATQEATATEKLVYFPGCFAQYNDPSGTSKAYLDVLKSAGIEPEIVHDLCCGLPLLASGYIEEADKAARKLIEKLNRFVEQGYSITTTCTSCLLSLKHDYVEYFDIPGADKIASASKSFSEILLEPAKSKRIEIPGLKAPLRVAYHTPCHEKTLRGSDATMELLENIPGIELIKLPEKCCGLAGSFGFRAENYELSMEIGKPLFHAVKESGADAIITSCGACRMQLEAGTNLKSFHPARILLSGMNTY